MVVEAVSRGIVSGKFPENGKSTGNFANLMVALPPYPILTFYFYCHFLGRPCLTPAINREISG
jgi:hypothetical protein